MADPADPADPTDPDDPDDRVDRFVETSFAIIAQVTRVGAENGLSLTAVRMLGILRGRTLTMAELADFLGLERSTVSGLVDRAERRGLVVREMHASDGRSTRVRLTPDGHQQVDRAAAEIATRIAPIIDNSGLAPNS